MLGRTVGLAPLHHQHEVLRLPTEPYELRLQALPLLFTSDVDAAVTDSGCALNPLGLGSELLSASVPGLFCAEEVEVVHAVQARVDDHRPVRRRLEPLGRALVESVHEREGALELTHRQADGDARAC